MNWNLNNIYQHKDQPLIAFTGAEMHYSLSGRGGWDVFLGKRKVNEDVDGLVLCAILNLAQAEMAQGATGER